MKHLLLLVVVIINNLIHIYYLINNLALIEQKIKEKNFYDIK